MKTSFLLFILIISLVTSVNSSPQLFWSTFLGGNSDNYNNDIKVDSNGNSFITGTTYSPDFPISTGAYQTKLKDSGDVFVTKLNSTGDSIIFSTFIGGKGRDEGKSIAIDKFGNSYISGSCNKNYPTTSNAFDTINTSYYQPFVTKLNSTGTNLLYSTLFFNGFESYGSELYGNKIVLDAMNNTYIINGTSTLNFPVTPGAYDTTRSSISWKIVITKLNPEGSSLIYSTFLGGSKEADADDAEDITLDSLNNSYIAGYTTSRDFPITSGVFQTLYQGIGHTLNSFLTKLNSAGSALMYSTFICGIHDNDINSIAVDKQENAYITGSTATSLFPTTSGSYKTSINGDTGDCFITKLNSSASSLIYSTFIGAAGWTFSNGGKISLDNKNNAYIVGITNSPNFPVTDDALDSINNIYPYAIDFLTILNANGTNLIYSSFLGFLWSYAFTLDNFNDIYITGLTASKDFPVTSGAFDTIYSGYEDGFVVKYGYCNGSPKISSYRDITFPLLLCSYEYQDTTIIFYNIGSCLSKISNANFLGGDSSKFSIIEPNHFPVFIEPGDSIEFVIRYIPDTITGTKRVTLSIGNNSTAGPSSINPWVINLTAYNYKIDININNSESDTIVIDLGTICPGSNKDTTITIFNKSSKGTTINISSPAPPFQVNGTDKTESGKGDKPEAVEKKK